MGSKESDMTKQLNNNNIQHESQARHRIYHQTTIKGVAAAAAAKSLQSFPTLCDPIEGSPPGSSIHGIFQARILEWVAVSFSRGSQADSAI